MDNIKKKIYIAGTNRLACFVRDIIDLHECEFEGFVSAKNVISMESFRGAKCISYDELKSEMYDYLIICEEGKYDDSAKIINMINSLTLTCMRISPEYYLLRKSAVDEMNCGRVKGIITGISSIQRGIIAEKLKYKMALCAAPTQDLYYDLYSLADAMDRLGDSLQYTVLGMVPYSFRYDLSLSSQSLRTLIYYREFNDFHHTVFDESMIKKMEREDALLDAYLYPIWRDICYDCLFDYPYNRVRDEFKFENLNDEEKKECMERMYKLGNKPYPETLKENRIIFESYIKLCKKRGIRVIILIPPFCSFFRNQFPVEYVDEMREIIKEAQIDLGAEVIDLYDDPFFDRDDIYADLDHLNAKGAMFVTERINSIL